MYQLLSAAITAAVVSSPVAAGPGHPASCTADFPARIIQSVTPEYPALAQLARLAGKSVIRVDLSNTGNVVGAYVAVSSGSSNLDQAAIRAAKSMVYGAETRSCEAIPGSYAVEVEFPG